MFTRYESLPRYFKLYPMTSIIILICTGLFIAMCIVGSPSSSETLYSFGGFYADAVKEGQWYRFVSGVFLHLNFIHLLMNAFFLYLFGPHLEQRLGKGKFILFFVLTGIGSFVLPFFFSSNLSVGISGSIYAMFAMYLFLIHRFPHHFSPQDTQTVYAIIIIGFISSFLTPNVSILGHVSGFIFGWILSYLFLANRKK